MSQPQSSSTRLLRPGGLIIADNILRRGLVADSSSANPWAGSNGPAYGAVWRNADVQILDGFNKAMVNEERLETFLMPLFDGLGMARLKN